MKDELNFVPIVENHGLVGETVFELSQTLEENQRPLVAKIDPQYMGGKELFEHYGVDPNSGGNCVVVEVVKPEDTTFAAIVIPVGYRADLNHFVKKHFNAKRISLAAIDKVTEMTKMEYGSITPFGLPSSWHILIDSRLAQKEKIIVGGGKQVSKLLLPVATLLSLLNIEVIDHLSEPIE